MYYEYAALGAAFSWVFASLLAADASRELGGLAFNRLRVVAAFLMLLIITAVSGDLQSVPLHWYPILAVSGVAGLAIGDSALFAAFKRLGPRRAQVLYACNAPMAVILGILFLSEAPNCGQFLGIAAVFSGVVIAIIWGKRKSQIHRWEQVQGLVWIGIALGLLSGLGQAVGSLIVKPALEAGVDPVAASTVRLGAAALVLLVMRGVGLSEPAAVPITLRHVTLASANAFVAVVVGVSLLLWAFANGDVGIASVLSATTPVMILPVLWLRTRERPALGAWIGASIAVCGTAAIILY
ncbi:MAG: DMT family transporter [Acidiferrobacterales bacterium]|nr:DMT family transporter [Acidiferrobacterales bacterium]